MSIVIGSIIASIIGLFAFTIDSESLFSWNPTDNIKRALRVTLISVLFIYFLDSLLRVRFIENNIFGWTDYDLKWKIKNSSYLCYDTNTLAIRVIFLYLISKSVGLIRQKPISVKFFFLYLMLSCFSRAGLLGILFIYIIEMPLMRRMEYKFLLIISIIGSLMLEFTTDYSNLIELDSSAVSKIDLFSGSIDLWLSSSSINQLFGFGYYSNIDVGTTSQISGHSIIYYSLVDFGVIGSLLIGALLYKQAENSEGRYLLLTLMLIGLSIFRFDFLFLYFTLFFVNHVGKSQNL